MQYRSEIDGLRALAIIPVILYHYDIKFFDWGFIGVDVFFVISGYLITSIILREISKSSFSLIGFYERRAKRIFPAFFFTILVTLIASFIIMSPLDFQHFMRTVTASSIFSANLFFWHQTGYFEPSAHLTPLIHIWSLSLEEQFYIVWPLILILFSFKKFSSSFQRNIILFITFLSLSFYIIGVWYFPNLSFYFFLTRAWELLLGALCAMYLFNKEKVPNGIFTSSCMPLVGIILIFSPIITYKLIPQHVMISVIMPVIGTAIIILNNKNNIIGKFLSNKILVNIGLLSFTIYLTHQPIISLIRYYSITRIDYLDIIIAFIFTLFISVFIYNFIEKPFRYSSSITRSQTIFLSLSIISLLSFSGVWFHFFYKAPSGIHFKSETIQAPKNFTFGIYFNDQQCTSKDILNEPPCQIPGNNNDLNGKIITVVGDSHARGLSEAIYEKRYNFHSIVDLSKSACPYLDNLGTYYYGKRHISTCTPEFQEKRLEIIKNLGDVNTVTVIFARYPLYYFGNGFDNQRGGVEKERSHFMASSNDPSTRATNLQFQESLRKGLKDLSDASEKLIVVLPTHVNGWHPLNIAYRKSTHIEDSNTFFNRLAIDYEVVKKRNHDIDQVFKEFANNSSNTFIINPREFTCSEKVGHCYPGKDGKFYFSDEDHLSPYGNSIITEKILDLL